MRFAGMRVNLMWLGAAIAVVLAAIFFFAGHGGPTSTAEEFMQDLAKGDVAGLTDISYVRGSDKEALRKAYEFSTQEAGKNYSFMWRVKNESQADPNTASVQLAVIRNARSQASYEENFEIPLVRQNGKWLVDVGGVNALLYPALPR